MVIYKIQNKINGKLYIGQTTRSIKKRWYDHAYKSKKSHTYAISNAIKKYGVNNFEIKQICMCNNLDEMNAREIYLIKLYDSAYPNGYNIEIGGNNSPLKESTKRKISQKLKGIKRKRSSVEKQMQTRKKNGVLPPTLGHKFDQSYKNQKREEMLKRIVSGNHPALGVKYSKKAKQNMAIAHGAKLFGVYDKNSKFIGKWINQSECAKELRLDRAKISEILSKKTSRKTHKGYFFKFLKGGHH